MTSQKRKKMDIGNVRACLEKAHHHVSDNTLCLMLIESRNLKGDLRYRFRIQREELEEVIKRIERIKEIATQQNNEEILTVLNEQFEFGHDLPGD